MSIRAMNRVWANSVNKGSVLLLLLAVADYAQDDGTGCFAGVETLAAKTRMSARNVQYLIEKAEKSGELSVDRRASKYGTNEYTLHIGHANFAPPTSGGDTKPTSGLDTKPTSSNTLVDTSVKNTRAISENGTYFPELEPEARTVADAFVEEIKALGFKGANGFGEPSKRHLKEIAAGARDWVMEHGETPGLLQETVRHMRSERLVVASPRSCIKVARQRSQWAQEDDVTLKVQDWLE